MHRKHDAVKVHILGELQTCVYVAFRGSTEVPLYGRMRCMCHVGLPGNQNLHAPLASLVAGLTPVAFACVPCANVALFCSCGFV